MILETSNQSVWSNVFWYVKVSIFWKCIQCIIHWDKSQILKQFPSEKINGAKNAPFFLSRAPTHHSWFLYGLGSTRFVSLKLCVGYSIFDSVPFLLKFILMMITDRHTHPHTLLVHSAPHSGGILARYSRVRIQWRHTMTSFHTAHWQYFIQRTWFITRHQSRLRVNLTYW